MELDSYNGTVNENVLTTPQAFETKLNFLNDVMPILLEEFKQAYVFYNMTPSDQEYQNAFFNIRNNVISANAQLFMTTNSIQQNVETINKDLITLNENIQKQKFINDKLKQEILVVDNNVDSSKQRVNEYTEMYKSKYLSNITVFIGIIIGIFACKNIFTVKNIVNK